MDDYDYSFNFIKFNTVNLLLTAKKPSIEYLQELKELLDNIIEIIRSNSPIDSYKNILQMYAGGNQVYHVFECLFQGKKVAVKLYKPIITHLVVHTVAITYLSEKNSEFDQIINSQI